MRQELFTQGYFTCYENSHFDICREQAAQAKAFVSFFCYEEGGLTIQKYNPAHLHDIGKLRFLAAAWFAVASCIPLIPIWIEMRPYTPGVPAWYDLSLGIFLDGILPVFVAGMFGYSVGSRILSSSQTGTAKQAVLRGLKVGLFSFSVFALVFSLMTAVHLSLFEPTPGGTFVVELVQSFFGALVMVIIMGGIILGWLIALVAATAGWLLYKIRPLLLGSGQTAL